MKQVFIIHGGTSFYSYQSYFENLQSAPINYEQLKPSSDWRDWLVKELPDADILTPRFPNSQNAQYEEWKIYFEKLIPFFGDNVHLVGYSLGAMFLAKYLHETTLPKKVSQVILMAAGYNDETTEELGSFKVESAEGLERSTYAIHLLHSEDDPIVPFTELAKFQADLPTATAHTFTDRSHFFVETLPELLTILREK